MNSSTKSLLALSSILLAGCSVERHPMAYPYEKPISSSRGCSSVIGSYSFTFEKGSRQGEMSLIGRLFNISGQPNNKWGDFIKQSNGVQSISIVILGDLSNDLLINIFNSNSNHNLIDRISLNPKKGDYTCNNGTLNLRDIDVRGDDHEVGSYKSHSEFSISTATDGALVGHFFSSKRGWAWFIPYYQTNENWVVIQRSLAIPKMPGT